MAQRLLMAACVVVAPVARAQELTGTVRDAGTGMPLAGAVVTTIGTDRRPRERALSSRSGAFRLGRGGARSLRVVRIGYRPWEMPLERVGSGALTIEMVAVGNLLDAVLVSANAVCPARPDQREALALWATAQDGMLAVVVASSGESESGEVIQILFDRRLESDGRGIYTQSTRRVRTGNVAPIRAGREPHEFARSGYVERTPDGTTYYAPDPATLLDSTFAATHCLSVRRDARGHPDEIGVAFAPVARRDTIPDIAGVLWLSRTPLALRSLDFEYVGIDSVVRATRAGGRLDFETLSNGVPIIRYWHVRSPRLLYLPSGNVSRGRAETTGRLASVASLHENGALIASGTFADGTTWSAPLAAIAGRIVNARTGDVVPGARVVLDSTDHATVSDAEGRFVFEGLLPGPHVVRVTDSVAVPSESGPDASATDTLRARAPRIVARTRTLHVEATLRDVRQVEVRLPWRDALGPCYAPEHPRRRFIVVGTVVTPDSMPVPQAAVRLAWGDSAVVDSAGSAGSAGSDSPQSMGSVATRIDALTDATGRFVVCGVPAEVQVGAEVRDGAGARHVGSLRVPIGLPPDDEGRVYRGPVRFVTLVVTPSGRR